MDDTAFNNRSLPLDWNGSVNPGQLNEVTMGTRLECTEGGMGGFPLFHRQSLDQMSPIRGRTMKEYDQQIVELKNENFNLKLRIYFLEERLQQKFTDSSDDLHKFNIDLKIEIENLKKELNNKHELLMKASTALELMEGTQKAEMKELHVKYTHEKSNLEEEIHSLKQKLSISKNGNYETQDGLHHHAFAAFATSDSERHTEMQEMETKIGQLQDEISTSQNRIEELEKCLSDKDARMKEVEITTVKTHKFVQGIMNAIRDKEKQLQQMQEQYDIQSIELKETKDALNFYSKESTDINVPVLTTELSETNQNKQDAVIRHLESRNNEWQEVINACLKLVGVIDTEVCNCSSDAVLDIFKLKLRENEERTESLLKEKCKMVNDKENELMQYREQLQETENQLKLAFKSIEELDLELHRREDGVEKLNSVVRSIGNCAYSDGEYEKRELGEDIIGYFKDYLELPVHDSSHEKVIELKSAVILHLVRRGFANETKSDYFGEKLTDLEYIIRTYIAKKKLLHNDLITVHDRISLLRKLMDGIQNGGENDENPEINSTIDSKGKMRELFRGIKVMSNLSNLFCHRIKLNDELSRTSQMFIDAPINLAKLKCARCASLITNEFPGKVPNSSEKDTTDGCDEEKLLNAVTSLRSDYLTLIDGLTRKVSKTENSVCVRSNANDATRSSLNCCESVDDLLLSRMDSILFPDADNDLNLRKKDVESTSKCNVCIGASPCATDSLFEYGRANDVLELKEQVCRLKLLLEQREHELNEMWHAQRLTTKPYLSHLQSYLKEQTLTPSERNSLTDLTSEIRKIKTFSPIGDYDARNICEANTGINDDPLLRLDASINEISRGKYSSFIQLQREDILMLRNRLLASHDVCELLRIRLEELTEFMEHLLRFDLNGLVDNNLFTPQRLELLKRRIAESKELTNSISHSLLGDVDLSNVTDSTTGRDILDNIERNNFIEHKDKRCRSNEETIHHEMSSSGGMNIDYRRSESEDKLVESSCDDLILLLNPNKSNTPAEERAIMAAFGHHYASRQYADCGDRRLTNRRTICTLSHDVKVLSDTPRLENHVAGDLSPSETESWSEPDRNVSQQRIGLELNKQECLKPNANSSSSNVDSLSDASNSKKNNASFSLERFRNDEVQMENLYQRLQNQIDVNKCLRSELELIKSLQNENDKNSRSEKTNHSKRNNGRNKARAILSEHLLEIRGLRSRLEESIHVTDVLREKLEKRFKTRQHQHFYRLEDEIGRLVGEAEDKEHSLNELGQQIRCNLSRCCDRGELKVETKELRQQLIDLTETSRLSNAKIQQIERELVSREEGSRLLKDANLGLQNSIVQLQTALTTKEEVISELHEANNRMRVSLETMDKLHGRYKMELETVENEKKNELEVWKRRERELNDELGITKEKSDGFLRQFEELKLAIAHTEEQLEREHGLRLSAQQKTNEMENYVATCKEKANGLETKLREIEVELGAETQKNVKLQRVTAEREMKIIRLQDNVGELEKNNLAQNALIQQAVVNVKVLELKLDALNEKTAREQGEVGSKVAGCEDRLVELQKMLKDKTESLRKWDNGYEQLQMILDERSTTIRMLEDELRRVMEENETPDNDESTVTMTSTRKPKDNLTMDLPILRSRSIFTLNKYASHPSESGDIISTDTNQMWQSKSLPDCLCYDSTLPSIHHISEKTCGGKLKQSISSQLDSHSVYSSPDLGIESDPSHFSTLEKRITNITEEHLLEIRSVHRCDKNSKRISADKILKQNAKLSTNNQSVFAIGSLKDYELLKKYLENNMSTLKALQNLVKERLQCSTRTSVKNSKFMTLKEIEEKINCSIIGLGKSLKLVSCFWKSMLNFPLVNEGKNSKLREENLSLKKNLEQQKINLHRALSKLAASSRLKEGMEKAIMKQLAKTHDVLKQAKGNLEDQANNSKN